MNSQSLPDQKDTPLGGSQLKTAYIQTETHAPSVVLFGLIMRQKIWKPNFTVPETEDISETILSLILAIELFWLTALLGILSE